jgi:Domain of unknown function (DUF4129)
MRRVAALTGTVAAGLVALLVVAAGSALAGGGLVSRDAGADEARQELGKGIYHRDDPGPLRQVYDAVVRWLNRLLNSIGDHAPGGGLGLIVIAAALGLLVWFALWHNGPLRAGARRAPLLSTVDGVWTARQHRERAAELTTAGRYQEAVREWLRASARDLEERGVLEPRPGRTADEVAADAAAQVPEVAAPLAEAAAIFDEVWYGGRAATAALADRMRAADDAVRQASLVVATR